jgi:hypothetical protein
MKLPFKVPPFYPTPPASISYVWWSWHPNYPYWSQSCWAAPSVDEAMKLLESDRCGLSVYHNKLIRHDGITLVEVRDVPCKEMEVWRKIKRQRLAKRK